MGTQSPDIYNTMEKEFATKIKPKHTCEQMQGKRRGLWKEVLCVHWVWKNKQDLTRETEVNPQEGKCRESWVENHTSQPPREQRESLSFWTKAWGGEGKREVWCYRTDRSPSGEGLPQILKLWTGSSKSASPLPRQDVPFKHLKKKVCKILL